MMEEAAILHQDGELEKAVQMQLAESEVCRTVRAWSGARGVGSAPQRHPRFACFCTPLVERMVFDSD